MQQSATGAGDMPPLPSLHTPRRRTFSAGSRQSSSTSVASPSARMMQEQEQDPGLVIPFGGQNPLLHAAHQQALAAAATAGAGAQGNQDPPPNQPAAPLPPVPPQPAVNIEKFTTESIEFFLYTDPELESHRMLNPLPSKDRNRLSRQTISAMRTKTLRLRNPREPERSEILQMAQALCMKYPGLRDPLKPHPSENWVGLRTLLIFLFYHMDKLEFIM